ncbi:exodeoxyribonuclease VII large subunit [Thermovirga sp.]|uniref:exodeoxyribonuclease VII large subunit n=1 Tax=Thermovirga sp. TaxID=2699834 RepID=UPI0025D6BACC|nr:exodeoxyribonuclease VII large subunit [Thermovirga sp.]MBO8153554.1 exodeoxyribonuclease VII large subunit [Thermovirga sp.]
MVNEFNVDQLTEYIKGLLEQDPNLRFLRVIGELFDFKIHSSGHVYFTILGKESRLNCVLFKSDARDIPRWPQKGDLVAVEGRVGLYPPRGAYQLYAKRLMPIGKGAIARAKEELKDRLEKEGLFDVRLKRPIPKLPLKAAIITSPTGAAVKDVIKVSSVRFPQCELVIVPCLVQGLDAPSSIVKAIRRVNFIKEVDVALLVRGGGSRDDLNPFDDETVVRAVRLCPVPIVTGLGHEVDLTLADMAADFSAPTPSAAAERTFPDRKALLQNLEGLKNSLVSLMKMEIKNRASSLENAWSHTCRLVKDNYLWRGQSALNVLSKDLVKVTQRQLENYAYSLGRVSDALDAASPLKLLAKGFAFCKDEEGNKISSADKVSVGQNIIVQLLDGDIKACVSDKVRLNRKL